MRAIVGFVVGGLVGAAGAIGATTALRPGAAPALAAPADPHRECRAREEALTARVAALEQAARVTPRAEVAVPAPATAAATVAAGDGAATPASGPAAGPGAAAGGAAPPAGGPGGRGRGVPEDPAITRMRELGRTVANAAPEAPERTRALQDLMEALRSPDPAIARAAAEALAGVAYRGKLGPEEVAALETERAALPAGHAARPALAGAVAAGWAKDPRLGPWLDALATATEPAAQVQALRALDKTPSEPFRAFVLRLTQETKDPDVLDGLWDEDRMYAACTRENSGRLAQAIEARLAGPGIPRETRGLGFYALGLASLQDPAVVAPLLARRTEAETDPAVRALATEVAKLVASGEANVAALEEVWDRLRRTLREPKPAPAAPK